MSEAGEETAALAGHGRGSGGGGSGANANVAKGRAGQKKPPLSHFPEFEVSRSGKFSGRGAERPAGSPS